ncbi:hypothetical protein J6590_106448 [Homalodisca vitripennis]|nr:hypothetical protein J6590_106448 [Homalodisca vitripennis]
MLQVASGLSPRGWPLSLGSRGVVLHLGELDSSLLRSRDCYLCVRVPQSSAPQVALVWPGGSRATSPPPSALAMMTAAEELPDLLHHLVVSVERAIERVPLDDLPFPCPQCHECLADQECVSRCQCATAAEKRDSCMQTSPMYELDASIPHIDSDEEHDDDKKHSLVPCATLTTSIYSLRFKATSFSKSSLHSFKCFAIRCSSMWKSITIF